MYLLDTMVVSEETKSRPEPRVASWMHQQSTDRMFVSALSIGEILFGVRRMPSGNRRSRMEAWARSDLPAFYQGRVLAVTESVAQSWAILRESAGRTLPLVDSLIAATALTHNLTLVTRNRRDFDQLGLRIYNPWE